MRVMSLFDSVSEFSFYVDDRSIHPCLVIWSNYSKVTNDSGKDISVHGPGNNVSANVNSSSFVHRNDTISKETRRRTDEAGANA